MTYDSSELVLATNWCIERTGAPLGRQEADTDGFFGVTARFGPRINVVMIGFRHYGPAVAYRALDTFAEKYLRPHGIQHELAFDQNVHTYPYIVLPLVGLIQWFNLLRDGRTPPTPSAVPLYTTPRPSERLPLLARERPTENLVVSLDAGREYHDPHDQPPDDRDAPPARLYALSTDRLRAALGDDAYNHKTREGWHVEGRGRFAALRLGNSTHSLSHVKYVFEQYGIATRVEYGGYELAVNPDDIRNAPFRTS